MPKKKNKIEKSAIDPSQSESADSEQASSELLDSPVIEGEIVVEEPELIEGELLGTEVDLSEELDAAEVLEDENEAIDANKAPASRGVVPYDPLNAYMREIAEHPRLSKEEENALAQRYREDKDLAAAYRLVTSNLWLVVRIAKEYQKAARNLLDIIQEGNIGLMEAVKNFDPYKGVRLPSYAAWWIRAYMVRYIMANIRMVKIGTTQAQRKLFFNLKKEKDKLEREGFFPAPKLLAEKLNVKESEVIEMEQRLSANDLSVDMPTSEDSAQSYLSIIPNEQDSAEAQLIDKQYRRLLAENLRDFEKTLKPKERMIFTERMLTEDKATLQEVSEKIHVSKERVRQIENAIRDKLKAFLQERMRIGE